MEHRIEYAASEDGSHILQRITLGPLCVTMAIPVAMVGRLATAMQTAYRSATSRVIVPGRGVDWDSTTPVALEDGEEQRAPDSEPDGN